MTFIYLSNKIIYFYSREKYINSQLDHLLVEFRAMQDQLGETKEKYKQGSGGVTERSRILAEVRNIDENYLFIDLKLDCRRFGKSKTGNGRKRI